ncbi:MAG: hypothetical protein EOL93_10475 [Epsilonproteobacteria bacterium]|nr:hypothetical protein [Campylobacterota bacterium]
MQKFIINQNINNQHISKISVMSNDEDITALKSILLLPTSNELVKDFYFLKLQLRDKDLLKTYVSFAIPSNKNEQEVYHILKDRYYNLRVSSIHCILMQHNTWSYEKYFQSIQKGKNYEQYVYTLLIKKGYRIIHNCLELNKLDKGIDFIASKENIVLFIQCKNYENTEITHTHFKEFYANCNLYLNKNSFENMKKRFLYLSSCAFLSDSARYFLRENPVIEFKVLKYHT